MEQIIDAASSTVTGLLPAAAVFGLIAVAMKRDKVLAAIHRARGEIRTNMALLALNGLLVVPVMSIPIFGALSLLPRSKMLGDFWQGVPDALVLVAAIVINDFAAYWRHRAEHSRSLWPIHATHHADEAMNWLTLRRKHPLGELLSKLLDLVPMLLLGLPMWAIFASLLLRGWWGYFIHADVPWTLGPLGRVLISPAAHRLHHIRDEQLMGFNYGNTITLWDRLFGTYLDPAPYIGCETGIAEGTRDLLGELARPFEARYRRSAVVSGPEETAA